MAILLDGNTRVLVQGITGREGSVRTRFMKEYGTKIVAGVTPGRGGEDVWGYQSTTPCGRPGRSTAR